MTSRLLGLTARQPAISAAMMMRSTVYAALLGAFLAGPALYMSIEQLRQNPAAPQIGMEATGKNTINVEDWPICTSAGLGRENADWAELDPDFAAGKKAMIAKDWDAAVSALASAALRDPRNADIQAYLGVSYRNLRQFGPAFRHYQQALALNPRHRGAHAHAGAAHLALHNLAKAQEHLTALEKICLIPCKEYDDLRNAIAQHRTLAKR